MPADKTHQRAAQILERTGPDLPADAVMREMFSTWKRGTPAEKRAVARAVFAHSRWQGWLDADDPMIKQIAAALTHQRQFDQDPESYRTDDLAAHAVPAWVHDQIDFTPAELRALQTEPVLWIRARSNHTLDTAKTLKPSEPAPAPADTTGFRYLGTDDLYRTPGFKKGHFEIQDLGSQLIGHACAPQPGETWWDTCCGEGGKTLHLADLMQGKGLIWASDRSNRRLARLKQRTARAEVFNYRAINWNGGEYPPTKTKFDGILIDAPCSGVGTWRRNPHARWTTSLTDVHELAVIQRQLLTNVANSLKPGGRLIYAVCTTTRSETTAVADAFTTAHPELEPLSLLDRGPQVFLKPAEWNANGMFLAGWKRASNQ
ncbi:RsmB/NOP family class I SAM-dependent RNA methyltransferase [Synoicihabitans lomoniglobus]|uniref:RsmB/NOP family class I SAM-dependent RNA methyltransferase n=1 Tax=Synoicihabitans lomoniglobus TaxID=2909285 RepID=A0AAF0CLT2_9BACT|nr:RsmB/NOP family class I SAM-dependent RNA methyltransferase [Opitutaceae bacterium LMO-M01]WED63213.1 RsmB/NOP family class I SAM-dependent RNA methyltransferase [Opitutaceae bacterium LMO-M01]